jgi:hypothetical protein
MSDSAWMSKGLVTKFLCNLILATANDLEFGDDDTNKAAFGDRAGNAIHSRNDATDVGGNRNATR